MKFTRLAGHQQLLLSPPILIGVVMNIINLPNPNSKFRPGDDSEFLVIHAHAEYVVDSNNDGDKGSGFHWHCTDWLRAIGLSCHALNMPDGRIIREVDSWRLAHHARDYNRVSIGMEFVVSVIPSYDSFLETMKTDWLSPAQFDSGVERPLV